TSQNVHTCLVSHKSTSWLSRLTLNFCLYKPCAMCLSLLYFQPCAGSEPDCNCCLSNKYTYMQLRSPEVTRVNFHLSGSSPGGVTFATGDTTIFRCVSSSNINTPHTQHSISICLSHTHTPH